MPVLAQDEVIGNLVLWSDTALPLAEAQHQLAIALSEHIALALANIRLRETLQTQSIRDALTNLYNRRYLAQTLPEALSLARAHNTPLSLVMVDIDWFKQINDTFGHQVGDRVLETVARFLQNSIREHDLAYRYGGEEFLLVLKNIEAGVVRARVKQLCQNLRQLTIACAERSLSVTASFGIATFPESGRTATELLEAADAALYQAKAQGRDRVIFASPHPSD
jgi:diguanylate cyclase (GGDEF)-like protein